jgi:predicted dehydrogenase
MRIGLLGLGFMGSTHLKAYQKIPGVEIVAVCSKDEQALTGDLSHIQGNIGGPGEKVDFSNTRIYRDADEFLADNEMDAVDICLPTDAHAPAAIVALNSGKHVLVEKPFALEAAQADAMLQAADASGKVLMCAQVLRFFPAYVGLRHALKRSGKVHSAIFRRRCAAPFWSTWLADARLSGGGVFDLLIHDVDMALHLFGKPNAVSATGHEDMANGIDVVTANFHYDTVPSVVITGGWHHIKSYPFSMEFTVVSDAATYDFNSSRGEEVTEHRKNGEMQPMEQPKCDAYEAEIRYFVECALAGEQPSICPPEESATAVKLARLIVEARTRNGEKIPCNL